jgi:hypothetical protein
LEVLLLDVLLLASLLQDFLGFATKFLSDAVFVFAMG